MLRKYGSWSVLMMRSLLDDVRQPFLRVEGIWKLSEHAVTPTQQVTGNFAALRMRPLRIFHGYLIPTRRVSQLAHMPDALSSKISA